MKLWQMLRRYITADTNLALVLLVVVIVALYPPCEIIFYKHVIGVFLQAPAFNLRLIVIFITFALYRISLIPLESYYQKFIKVTGEEIQFTLHHELIKSSTTLSLQWRESATGEAMLSQSLAAIKQKLPQDIIPHLFTLIKGLISTTLYLWFIAYLGWDIFAQGCLILVLLGVATHLGKTTNNREHVQEKQLINLRNTLCDLDNQKEIQLYQGYDYLIHRWKMLYQGFKSTNATRLRRALIKVGIFYFSSLMLSGVLLFNSISATLNGVLTQVELLLLILILLRLYAQVPILTDNFSELKAAQDKCESLFALVNMKQDKVKEKLAKAGETAKVGFELNNVSFAYPGSDRQVLQDISFTINHGETVAIVGENGAGKSTLAKLMLGLYLPSEGEVLLDGLPLTTSKKVSAVFQDYTNYHLTVRENIGFGDLANLANDQSIFNAAEKAGALELIRRKQLRLDDTLGNIFGKTGLSGGEWQALAIARGFMGDKEILVIDEPTASLDPFKEGKLLSKYLEHTANKTTIIISHKLFVASLVDKILLLKEGRLVEVGSHKNLFKRKGYYWDLWYKQSNWYADIEEVADHG